MGISINTRQSYSEIDEFLSLLKDEEINKIPKQLINFFKEQKDKDYKKVIDKNIPIRDQNLKEETLAIIAFLNLQYWCEDEKEKERLKQIYEKNEKEYEEVFKVDFDPNKVFKDRVEIENEISKEELQVIPYKESILKKFLNKIKKYFDKSRIDVLWKRKEI